jgi:ferredoxin-NADP reductase
VGPVQDSRYDEAIVQNIRRESDSVLSLRLGLRSGDEFPRWEPGAHIALNLPNGLIRQYSLCGRVDDRSALTIAVLREAASRGGSAYLHEQVSVGDVLGVGEIRNNFPLSPAPEYVFVAGGIGITPLLPMIDHVNDLGLPWRLVYGGRTRASMAYLDRVIPYGARVAIRPQDECGLLDFATDVTAGLAPGAGVYACGPEVMLTALTSHCGARGVPLHVEHFRASEETLHGSGTDRPFRVELRRTAQTVEVSAGESIIEALERVGIFPRSDCREGTCGSCETTLLAGSVEHRDALLSDEERVESKTMMICVSRATSDTIALDL